MQTPIERVTLAPLPNRMHFLGRLIIFIVVQMIACFVIFWAGIVTLIGAFWQSDPNYIWIFMLVVAGFEFLTLRILFRRRSFVIIGILLFVSGLWLQHQDTRSYNERTCRFMKQSVCRPFGDGYMCHQETDNMVLERTISRGDVTACAALDEF